ncbi:outer membrane beta-barrel protein [Glaciecola sp. 1036]|uniref:outer membrane beta-barrel protein n=1 Tax=Alteromonadaceae TaxID=72275 RepID=UPI003D05A29D
MKNWFFATSFVLLITLSYKAEAQPEFYGIASAGFAQTEVESYELDSFSYKIGLGYELTKQWNIEFGYQSFGEENPADPVVSINEPSAELSALYLAMLGNAEGNFGQLYYKVGLLAINSQVDFISGTVCDASFETVSTLAGTLCSMDDTLIAGQLGLGFDFYIHHSTMIRTEIEWTKGQNGFESAAVYLGLRLNF